MSESVIEIRNRLRQRAQAARVSRPLAPEPAAPVTPEHAPPAFALEDPDTGRVTISTPLVEAAGVEPTKFVRQLSGRLVEAGAANRNGAFWAQKDLEFGLPTVANGPLNLGHVADVVVGTLVAPRMVTGEQAAAVGVGPHVRTDAVLWRWVRPDATERIETYLEQGKAFLSMECVASQIQCVGPNGCGALMDYADAVAKTERACEHVRERASHRRFIEPFFLGAAVIIPPDSPAWPNADLSEKPTLELQRQAAKLVEDGQGVPGVDEDEAMAILTSIRQWTARVS